MNETGDGFIGAQVELKRRRLRCPACGQIKTQRAVAASCWLFFTETVSGKAVEPSGTMPADEGKVDGNLRHDRQRLVEIAVAVLAMHRLHHLAEAQGNAVVVEFRPSGQRIGREWPIEQVRVGDVVIRLLGSGPREIGSCISRVMRHIDAIDGIARSCST